MGLGKCISFQIMAIWIYLVYLCQIFWGVDITLYRKRIALCRCQSFFPCCFFFTKTSRIETQKGAIRGWKSDVPSFTHLFGPHQKTTLKNHTKSLKCPDMGVSKNNGTPKSSILIGLFIINHPFWGTRTFGNIHIAICILWDAPPPSNSHQDKQIFLVGDCRTLTFTSHCWTCGVTSLFHKPAGRFTYKISIKIL